MIMSQKENIFMKVAIIGSRKLWLDDLGEFLPENTDEIISGGAKGIEACAKEYAEKNGIKHTEFRPYYRRFGLSARIRRDLQIAKYADMVIAIWDGRSHGSNYVIDFCDALCKRYNIVFIEK